MTKNVQMKALQIAAAAATIMLAPPVAYAAECFDDETDDPKAGNATAVVGPVVDVERLSVSAAFRPESGDDMFTGDTVRTGDDSHLQVKLCDWSTYTFSPNSESAISEFFDPGGAGRRRVVNFVRGGVRMSSGRDTEPGDTEVEVQDTGVTMGVRGTNVILVELDGFVYALLEGPVRDNSGLTPKGRVDFWTDENRDVIEATLKRPGFAVRIGPDGVSDPFRADDELLRRIYAAFVPVAPEDDGSILEYAGDVLNDSGQGAQEGDPEQHNTQNRNHEQDEQTEDKPEQPFDEEADREEPMDPMDPMDPMPPPMDPMIPVGDILPLDALEDFAAMQASPSGHVFALAPAVMTIDDGVNVTQQDGVVIFQLDIDWQNRTIAPEVLASFVRFDFSVTDPNDLSQDAVSPITPPPDFIDAYLQALVNSFGVAFADGAGNLAQYSTPTYMLTIRQGNGDTVTADVSLDYSDTDGQGVMYAISSAVNDLMLTDGEGELAYFTQDANLSAVYTTAELDGVATSGTSFVKGALPDVFSTLGSLQQLQGWAAAQLEINFDNRTVGGGSSFIAIAAAADPAIGGQNTAQFISLDQAVSFDSGLFGLSFFTLSSLSSDPAVLKGQALVGDFNGFSADIAGIFEDGAGNHLYTDLFLLQDFDGFPVSTIPELDGLLVTLGDGTFRYDGTLGGPAQVERSDGAVFFGDVIASIDISFSNRTVGGGNSFVAVSIIDRLSAFNLSFVETPSAISFDDALNNMGAFGFGADDFSGSNIDNALLLIRNTNSGVGQASDLYINFNDGAGGAGSGFIEGMSLEQGATPPPIQ